MITAEISVWQIGKILQRLELQAVRSMAVGTVRVRNVIVTKNITIYLYVAINITPG
jgi:hypothetical protein